MIRHYRIAGTAISVRTGDGVPYREGGELSRFAAESCGEAVICDVSTAKTLPSPSGEQLAAFPTMAEYREGDRIIRYLGPLPSVDVRTEYRAGHISILLRRSIYPVVTEAAILNAIGAERLLGASGKVILHASYVGWRGGAILFTAPSGAGKSTQAALWEEHRGAVVVNGDRAVLGLRQGRGYAYGLPYSGSSRICRNLTLPLTAVVCLEKAEENRLSRLGASEAFRRIWEGCCLNPWDRVAMRDAGRTVGGLVSETPVFRLSCRPDKEAVLLLSEAIERLNQENASGSGGERKHL